VCVCVCCAYVCVCVCVCETEIRTSCRGRRTSLLPITRAVPRLNITGTVHCVQQLLHSINISEKKTFRFVKTNFQCTATIHTDAHSDAGIQQKEYRPSMPRIEPRSPTCLRTAVTTRTNFTPPLPSPVPNPCPFTLLFGDFRCFAVKLIKWLMSSTHTHSHTHTHLHTHTHTYTHSHTHAHTHLLTDS
jgi:hypothetical protein